MGSDFEKSPVNRDKMFRKPLRNAEDQQDLGGMGAVGMPSSHPVEQTKRTTDEHAQIAWERLTPGMKNTEGVS